MHTLLVLSRRAPEYLALVEAARLPDLAIVSSADPEDPQLRTEDCDLALADPPMLRAVLSRLPQLRWAQSTWAGIEPLLDPSLRRDYVLTSACGVFGGMMTEYVFAYLLAHERLLVQKYAAQLEGRWEPTPPGTVRGKRLGLLGVGSIGADVARTAKHFGMSVRGYTRASEGCADVDEYFHGDQRLAFAAGLDYLVSIMPNTGETRHIIDDALLRALPPHAVVVNLGRGNAVDDRALAAALREGRLGGAVLDVFEPEPLPADHIFWKTPHLLITSHTAGLSVPADIVSVFADNYQRLRRGEPLKCRVDFARGY